MEDGRTLKDYDIQKGVSSDDANVMSEENFVYRRFVSAVDEALRCDYGAPVDDWPEVAAAVSILHDLTVAPTLADAEQLMALMSDANDPGRHLRTFIVPQLLSICADKGFKL